MMKNLSLQQIQFMLKTLPLPDALRLRLSDMRQHPNKSISDETADQLRDLCAEMLDIHGFDLGYQPTADGKKLESLIDHLFIG